MFYWYYKPVYSEKTGDISQDFIELFCIKYTSSPPAYLGVKYFRGMGLEMHPHPIYHRHVLFFVFDYTSSISFIH